MTRYLLTIALWAFLAPGLQPHAARQGNPRAGEPPLPVEPNADKPLIAIPELDWSDKSTWIKFALFVGSIVLAKRAFRQMQETPEEDD